MESAHAWVNTILVLSSLIISVWFANRRNIDKWAREFTELRVKVDTMWEMLLKRVVVEAVHRGLAEVHSPMRLINNSGEMLSHMADEIRAFYREKCEGMGESKAALAIEREFGTRLATEVCIPNNISFGICIIIALAVAKGDESLTEILNHTLPINADAAFHRKGSLTPPPV